ncbi:MAG: enolase C-terminal domain-like protein [Granulosicoccaceae bacterium]
MKMLSTLDEKIVAMDVWHAALPVNSRRDHGIGTVASEIEIVVVRLTGESGEVGYGEASPWSVFTGTPEASFAALDRYFRPLVVGSSISEFELTMQIAQKIVVHCTEAKAALEAAWLDLAGKRLAKPVWALLGGQHRNRIPLSCSLANPDFEQDKILATRLVEDGVRFVKIKTGFKDHAFDMMRLETLKTDFPSLTVRVDYNQGLAVDDALRQVPEIDKLDPDFIEQPVAFHEYDAMAELRSVTINPLLADESVFGPEDMKRAVRENIANGVSIKIMKSGGMLRAKAVSEMAADAGWLAYGGDMFETGLAHMAGVHMIAASGAITLGCEFYQASYYLNQDLLSHPFPIEGGDVLVPDTPGLGCEVNVEFLFRVARAHSIGHA